MDLKTWLQVFRFLFQLSVFGFVAPFVLAILGFGGEAFAQAGWAYSMLSLPFVVANGLFYYSIKKSLNKR
jgi:hypothetical protein